MAKFNAKREKTVKATVSFEGGLAFTQTPEKELISLLSTGIGNSFYEKETDRTKRLKSLIEAIAKKDKKFAAQALIYARTVFGQRSVTHLGAVNLVPFLSGDELGKKFFSKRVRGENKGGIVYRLDDMAEILACYLAKNGAGASLPNSIKKGFKDAIENSDKYQLAKYQMKSRGVSLVDIVNLVHPSETKKQGYVDVPVTDYTKAVAGTKFAKEDIVSNDGNYRISTLRALVLGILKQFNTVEDKNTATGQEVAAKVKSGEITKDEATKELTEKKSDNFATLIATKKIGYLALIRNLRNIIKTGNSELINSACDLVMNQDMIKKSLIWPHQIDLALEVMLIETNGKVLQTVAHALDKAYELSIPNLKELLPDGRTAIVFDTSGSMSSDYRNSYWSERGVQINIGGKSQAIDKVPAEKAALIAATFAKSVGGRAYHFGNYAAEITGWNPNDSINTLKREFMSHNGECGHGTCADSTFQLFENQRETYDRVILISDEQSTGNLDAAVKHYGTKFGAPYVYFINVCGYANVAMKENNKTFRLSGYSADIYTKVKELEIDVNAVINEIKKIEI